MRCRECALQRITKAFVVSFALFALVVAPGVVSSQSEDQEPSTSRAEPNPSDPYARYADRIVALSVIRRALASVEGRRDLRRLLPSAEPGSERMAISLAHLSLLCVTESEIEASAREFVCFVRAGAAALGLEPMVDRPELHDEERIDRAIGRLRAALLRDAAGTGLVKRAWTRVGLAAAVRYAVRALESEEDRLTILFNLDRALPLIQTAVGARQAVGEGAAPAAPESEESDGRR